MSDKDSAANDQVRITRRIAGLPPRLELSQIELHEGLRVYVEGRDSGDKYCIHFRVLSSFRLTDEGRLDKLLSKVWYNEKEKHALVEIENGSLMQWISEQSAIGLPTFLRCFVLICANDVIEVVCRDEPLIDHVDPKTKYCS